MFQNKMLYPLIFELGTEHLLIGEDDQVCWLVLDSYILPYIDWNAQTSHRQCPLCKNESAPKYTNLIFN